MYPGCKPRHRILGAAVRPWAQQAPRQPRGMRPVCVCVCVCVSFVHTSKGRKGAATKSQLWPQLHELGAACSWAAQQ